ncbi:WD40 repeat-like protein [Polychaeton citri CBS 116435]|uniref:WD40 repeat-like protein n=1 Tax=Polychaeton citri CBS 116435 TaxID=1314669 RepID=A0A9P4UNH9_9PEZI|nr:WD40 repeat-like protein [Polychaeton citri CBS 116435]
MTVRMPHVGPDPFPTQWHYTLTSNFSQDGVPAEWKPGAPHAWGTEVFAIHFDNEPNHVSLSQDDLFVAVACKNSVEIYKNDGTGAKKLSLDTTPQDWTVSHLEWRVRESDQNKYQIVVCTNSQHHAQGHAKRDALTQVYSLDVESWRTTAEPGLSFNCLPWPLRSKSMLSETAGKLLLLSLAHNDEQVEDAHDSPAGKIEVWSLAKPALCCTIPVQSEFTLWLEFSPDGSNVGVASTDQILRLFDAESGILKHSTEPLGSQINGGAFSPDGDKIACTCSDPRAAVQIFGTDGTHLNSIAFQPLTRSLAWSPDSSTLVYGAQGGFLQFFDLNLEKVSQFWRLDYPGIRPSPLNEPAEIQFIDDGRRILFATGMEGGVEVYSMEDNLKQRYEPASDSNFVRGKKRSSISWSPSHRKVLSLDGDGHLRFWGL